MNMKTIVVYYSLEGNTQYVAERIAEALGAGLLRLRPKKAYPDSGFKKFFWGGKSAVMAETPALEPYDFDPAAWDRIILGFPVWAGNVTPPIRTFIKENDLRGKRIAAFACQSGSGAEKAFEKLAKCIGVSGFEHTAVFIDPKSRPGQEKDEQIEAFCRELMAGAE